MLGLQEVPGSRSKVYRSVVLVSSEKLSSQDDSRDKDREALNILTSTPAVTVIIDFIPCEVL